MKLLFLIIINILSNLSYSSTINWGVEFKPSYIFSDRELSSFSYNNSTAPTGASKFGSELDEDMRSSFQLMQSNFNISITQNDLILNTKFDFVDFKKASPSFQLSPRMIELYVSYINLKVGLQKDLFSPLSPKTYNSVGENFYSGDLGYYRNQLVYAKNTHSFSIGQQAPNIEISEDFEKEIETNFLLQYLYDKSNEDFRYGFSLSYIYFEQFSNSNKVNDSKGINIFYQSSPTSNHLFKSELYWGTNLTYAGYFALSEPSTKNDLNEWGGYLEYEYVASSTNSFILGYSRAEVGNTEHQIEHVEVLDEVISKGIASNEKVYISNWHNYAKNFKIISEFSFYQTKFNEGNSKLDHQSAIVLQLGALINFGE